MHFIAQVVLINNAAIQQLVGINVIGPHVVVACPGLKVLKQVEHCAPGRDRIQREVAIEVDALHKLAALCIDQRNTGCSGRRILRPQRQPASIA